MSRFHLTGEGTDGVTVYKYVHGTYLDKSLPLISGLSPTRESNSSLTPASNPSACGEEFICSWAQGPGVLPRGHSLTH